jgi:hypothetical protein
MNHNFSSVVCPQSIAKRFTIDQNFLEKEKGLAEKIGKLPRSP